MKNLVLPALELVSKTTKIEVDIEFRDLSELCKYDVIADLSKLGIKVDLITLVGSSYINQKLTNDLDILVYMQSADMVKLSEDEQLILDNWNIGGSFDNENIDDKNPVFRSFRISASVNNQLVDVNVIAVNTKEEFFRFKQAADVCRLLQFCNKEIPKDLRIDIHKLIRENMSFDELLENTQ